MSRIDKAAGKMAGALLRVQRRTSDVVNGMLRRCSMRQMKRGLFCFVVISAGISCYVLADALTKDAARPLQVQPIRPAPYIIIDDDRLFGRSDEPQPEDYFRRYKDAIDSIRLHALQNKGYEK